MVDHRAEPYLAGTLPSVFAKVLGSSPISPIYVQRAVLLSRRESNCKIAL